MTNPAEFEVFLGTIWTLNKKDFGAESQNPFRSLLTLKLWMLLQGAGQETVGTETLEREARY
jgi:hypothetical protein